jgi:very-short-patch-repair endonuclease
LSCPHTEQRATDDPVPKNVAVEDALDRCRQLRRNMTDAEAVVWTWLRAKRFGGFNFRRQYACGPYILDFYCPARRLAIELDGGQHFELAAQSYDRRRSEHLRRHGIEVLRFPNDVVFKEPDAVRESIALALGISDPSP